MVNETVLSYLKNYINEFPIDKLKSEIISKGYTPDEFEEAMKLIAPTEERKEMLKPVEKKTEFKRIPSQPVTTKKKMKEPKVKKKEKPTKSKKIKPVKEKKAKTKPEKKAKVWPWILLLIVLGVIGVIILNYYGTSVFGFNIFRLI